MDPLEPAPEAPPDGRNNLFEQNQAIRENAEDRVGMFVAKFIYWFRIAMFSSLVVEIIIVLAFKWNENPCVQPLRVFLIIFAVNSTLLLVTNFYFFSSLIRGQQPPESDQILHRVLSGVHKTTELLDQFIMIFGFFAVSQKGDCRKLAPVLWGVTVQIVTLRFAIWIMPIFILTCMFCCFGTVLLMVSKYRKWRDKQKVLELLDSVPKYKYKREQTQYGNATIPLDSADCAICLSPYDEDICIRILECNHHYHLDCIDQWLCLTPSCPLCKRSVLGDQGPDNV